ncbi:TonB-dependent receptor [Aestuariicella hydrocarbonica]|uniref:TonB-dependent receptor n=1 Tax=Pseudomaricurvus hydrocarbonicus TaxID=1470433 RepID=A0A9E5MHH8_9GAMM|nr:TonB-dependent receptor [Aestuariicella hydrocarbonica]NHO65961.1 TonB-dependent receptor [Aestuariicella hydrocarbonica]
MKKNSGPLPSPQRTSNTHLQLASLALAIASANCIPNAVAQERGQGFGLLEEIVVTARRREESAQDIPVAVTAMSEDFLRSQNITELSDLGTHVPSFRVSNAGTTTNTPVLSIRGQRPTDVSMTLDQAVPIYFAEVVMTPAEGSNLSMYDLENVQVLKGPQGTLFGRNSTGGALLLSPKKPGTELGGYVETKLGDYNLRSLEGAVDLPVNEVVQLRLAGRTLERDGYQENVADNALHGEKFWDEDSKGLRLSMNLELSEDLSNLLMVSYDKNDMLGRVPVPTAFNYSTSVGGMLNSIHNGGLGENFGFLGISADKSVDEALARQQSRSVHEIETDFMSRDKVENQMVANTTMYNLTDNLSLKNVFGYRKVEMSSATDIDGTALPMFGTLSTGAVTLDPVGPKTTAEQFSNEIQLLGHSFDDRLEWIVGGYWYDMQGTTEDGVTQILGANPDWQEGGYGLAGFDPRLAVLDLVAEHSLTQISPAGDVHNEAYGFFGEGTFTFNELWALTVGLRQSWDKRAVTVQNYSGFGDLDGGMLVCSVTDVDGNPAENCERDESETYSSPTWRASLSYTPRAELMMYGSVSTGYRAGGFNLRGTDNATLQPFDEETVLTYEIGQKSDWEIQGVGSVRVNVAAYLQKYNDIQKTQGVVTDSGFGTATINAAKAEIKGFEADITFAPTQNLLMTLGYSFVDAGYDEWDTLVQDSSGTPVLLDASNGDFTYVPENSVTASIRYTLPLSSKWGEVTAMASVYWQDEMKTYANGDLFDEMAVLEGWSSEDLASAQSTLDADAYEVWNVRVDWHNVMGSNFDFAAFVNNASDEEYQVGGLNVISSLGLFAPTYGAPRTVGASLRYQF